MGLPPDMVVDGRRYRALLPGVGNAIDVTPGTHQVMLAYHKEELEVSVDSGQHVFVRFDLDPALFGKGFYPVLVDRKTAQEELHAHAAIDFGCVKD